MIIICLSLLFMLTSIPHAIIASRFIPEENMNSNARSMQVLPPVNAKSNAIDILCWTTNTILATLVQLLIMVLIVPCGGRKKKEEPQLMVELESESMSSGMVLMVVQPVDPPCPTCSSQKSTIISTQIGSTMQSPTSDATVGKAKIEKDSASEEKTPNSSDDGPQQTFDERTLQHAFTEAERSELLDERSTQMSNQDNSTKSKSKRKTKTQEMKSKTKDLPKVTKQTNKAAPKTKQNKSGKTEPKSCKTSQRQKYMKSKSKSRSKS